MWLMVASGAFVIFIDQASKWLVVRSPAIWNLTARRAFLGIKLFPRLNPDQRLIPNSLLRFLLFILISLSIVLLILYKIAYQNLFVEIAIGCALGGAASNLLDHFWHDAIIDFIDLGFWPSFNLADMAICIGVLIALINFR